MYTAQIKNKLFRALVEGMVEDQVTKAQTKKILENTASEEDLAEELQGELAEMVEIVKGYQTAIARSTTSQILD